MDSATAMHQPISWADDTCSSQAKVAAQEKSISDIKNLNPFECKVQIHPYCYLFAALTLELYYSVI
jgi:hypothetical protein